MLLRAALAAFLLLPLVAAPASAQELPPLADWSKGPEAKTKMDYLYTRCAAFYLALIKYDGISYAQPELEHMKKTAVAFASTAARARAAREGGKPEDYVAPISAQVETLADQYGGRVAAARQKPGRAVDTDAMLAQDDAVCRSHAGTPLKT